MRLDTTPFDGGRGLEQITIHAVQPARALLEHLAGLLDDPRANDTPETRAAILEAALDRLDDAERTLERFGETIVKPVGRAA